MLVTFCFGTEVESSSAVAGKLFFPLTSSSLHGEQKADSNPIELVIEEKNILIEGREHMIQQ